MEEAADINNHILVVAILAFYWALLRNIDQFLPRHGDEKTKPAGGSPGAAETPAPAAVSLDAADDGERGFDRGAFLTGARQAYEYILGAFASGNVEALRPYLGADVFEGFERAVAERRSRGEEMSLTFIGLRDAVIIGVGKWDDHREITVRFAADVVNVTRAGDGMVVDGDPVQIVELRDLWTFARPAASRDPNWKLIATDGE